MYNFQSSFFFCIIYLEKYDLIDYQETLVALVISLMIINKIYARRNGRPSKDNISVISRQFIAWATLIFAEECNHCNSVRF